MAFPNTSAGVYDQDRDLSQRGGVVISSTGAIVIEAERGPVGIPTRVSDKAVLKSVFGTKRYAKYGFGMHCSEHFMAHSNSLFVVRAVDAATARTAGAYLSVDDVTADEPVMKLANFDDGSNTPQGVLGNPLETLGFVKGTPGIENVLLYVCAASPGDWSKEVSVRIRPSAPLGTAVGEFSNPVHFYLEVFLNYNGSASVPVESYLCSRKSELDSESMQMYVEDRVNTASKYIRVKNNTLCPEVRFTSEAFEFLDGGADGKRPTAQTIAAAWETVQDTEAYEIQIMINAGYANVDVQRRMITVAAKRGDAVAILDVPRESKESARAVNYRRNLLNVNSSYGAMYGPYVQITDDVTGRKLFVPASGMVAAQYAYTDRVRAYYWAPAGITRGQIKVTDLEMKYNLGDRNALDQAQINVIRKIPGRGYVIMGAETLQTFKSGFSNVNVRRLVNGVKSVIRKAVLVSNFNPNDDFERLRIKNMVDDVIRPVKSGRGVYEWETICDERNNTSAVIANNDLVVDLILDPTIPAKRAHVGADIRNAGSSVNFTEN